MIIRLGTCSGRVDIELDLPYDLWKLKLDVRPGLSENTLRALSGGSVYTVEPVLISVNSCETFRAWHRVARQDARRPYKIII